MLFLQRNLEHLPFCRLRRNDVFWRLAERQSRTLLGHQIPVTMRSSSISRLFCMVDSCQHARYGTETSFPPCHPPLLPWLDSWQVFIIELITHESPGGHLDIGMSKDCDCKNFLRTVCSDWTKALSLVVGLAMLRVAKTLL